MRRERPSTLLIISITVLFTCTFVLLPAGMVWYYAIVPGVLGLVFVGLEFYYTRPDGMEEVPVLAWPSAR